MPTSSTLSAMLPPVQVLLLLALLELMLRDYKQFKKTSAAKLTVPSFWDVLTLTLAN
jgi:hypothetical protein